MPMMSTMTKGTPYPTIRDFVMVVPGAPNMLDLNSIMETKVFLGHFFGLSPEGEGYQGGVNISFFRLYLTCLKILKLIIDIQTNVARKK